MPGALQRLARSDLAGWLLYRLIRLYTLTLRLRIENEEPWRSYLEGGGTVLLCAWHQQFFTAIRPFRAYRHHRPSLMISRSFDGDVIAAVARRTGWRTARGSSSRGGRSALGEMIRSMRETRLGAHIVDGPKGPPFRLKAGVVKLAHATGAAVVPFYVSADRAWHARSWDRFLVPKPGALVVLRFGQRIELSATEDTEEFERQRLRVESIMRAGAGIDDGEGPDGGLTGTPRPPPPPPRSLPTLC